MDQPAAGAGKNWLPEFTIADPGSAPPGPGFTMSRDDARSMLALAKHAREQFAEMRQLANNLTRLTPPADEIASNSYNSNLVGDGQAPGAFGAGLANVKRMYLSPTSWCESWRRHSGSPKAPTRPRPKTSKPQAHRLRG
ncbi:hypothetical protein ACWEHA_04655 [Amycolatopsis nivea]